MFRNQYLRIADSDSTYAGRPMPRIRAAKIVLDSSFHIQEVDDIVKRLDSLEQKTENEP